MLSIAGGYYNKGHIWPLLSCEVCSSILVYPLSREFLNLYLPLVILDLRCCAGLSLLSGGKGCSLVAVCMCLILVASPVVEHDL